MNIVLWHSRSLMILLAAVLALALTPVGAKTLLKQGHNRQDRMLEEIVADFRATGYLTGRHRMSADLEAALSRVPRHVFVPDAVVEYAYVNRPLSIGHGQTISQPFIVALMTDLLDLEPGCSVLEIGTGSGYQAAVLAELGASVYSIEIIAPLAAEAATRLRELGYANVAVKAGDGNYGWPEAAPFDRIIVTAGGRLPPALLEQLADGGKLIIPLENERGEQILTLFEKAGDGAVSERAVLPVRFVPITGDN
ncbi:MAG: protein-L-isoaspartate(D-aspartate) O-methyltransferase [Gammaproteobacteria bacterium]